MPSRDANGTSAANEARAARPFRFGWGVRLAVPFCGVLVALVLAPGASADCPSFQHVKAYTGRVSENVGAVASGDYPASEGGGTQTIQLGRSVVGARVHFEKKTHHPNGDYSFDGPLNGGQVILDDVYEDTGTDYHGELKYNGPVINEEGLNDNFGGLGLMRRPKCRYKLAFNFLFYAKYQGDPEVNYGQLIGFGAFSTTNPIPKDLKLKGNAQVLPHPDYEPDNPWEWNKALVALNSPWMPDLITLVDCGSPVPLDPNCPGDGPPNPQFDTPASISWHLDPVYEKGYKP
jgi:hypothetical protein